MAASSESKYSSYIDDNLECCVCLDLVTDAHTLQPCFHTLCKVCVDQLIEKQQNANHGVVCPICNNFCKKEEIRANFFINNLAQLHRSVQSKEHAVCEQCVHVGEPQSAEWRCQECKMGLCTACKTVHLTIKMLQGHRIVPIQANTEMIVDQLVFCPLHPDKPIELYCQPCNLPICMKCGITKHRTHETETVEETLEKMVPEMEKNLTAIDENVTAIVKSVGEVKLKIEETKCDFEDCRQRVRNATKERIDQLKQEEKSMTDSLNIKENEEIRKLDDIREKLEDKQKTGENLKKVLSTRLERARHATLLNELVKGGLQDKINSVTNENQDDKISLAINQPSLDENNVEWKKIVNDGALGKLVYNVTSLFLVMGSIVSLSSRFWHVNLKKLFKTNFTKVYETQIPNHCKRITFIDNNIWVPLRNNNIVNLLNKDNGSLVKTIDIQGASSVQKAFNNDIFIGSCNNGIHVLNRANDTPLKISDGKFSDVSGDSDKMYALDYLKKVVFQYLLVGNTWKVGKKIRLNGHPRLSEYDSLIVSGEHIYVGSQNSNTIYDYNCKGDIMKKYTNYQLSFPMLCAVDKESNLLVADKANKLFKILDTNTEEWIETGVQVGSEYVYDIQMGEDGSLWIMHYKGGYMVTKLKKQ